MDNESQRVRFIASIIDAIKHGHHFDDVLDRIFPLLKRVLPCDRLAIGFLHGDGRTLIHGPIRSRARIWLETGHREALDDAGLFDRRDTLTVADLSKHLASHPQSQSARLLLREGFKSCLTAPLSVNSSLAGVLLLAAKKAGAYGPEHAAPAKVVAEHLALMLERTRMIGKAAANEELKSRLADENSRLRELIAQTSAMPELIGNSAPWRKTLKRIELVAGTEATVLIRGETGTGKELIARAIHRLSPRRDKPFVAINCGALSPQLIASELFGHEKGAFTGALQRKLGRIDLAQGGTLFLDEVGELPADMQVKLLRVLQEREFERVGGTQTLASDVRVIAATHRNLERERQEGRFRDDLYFRLNVFPLLVPPLRERKEDIEPLLKHFLSRYSARMDKTFERIDPQAIEQCLYYHWPGNIRELENLVERSVILSPGPAFFFDPLLEADGPAPQVSGLSLDAAIGAHLIKVLRMTNGKIYGQDGAAKLLGLKPSTLQAKLKRLKIDRRKTASDVRFLA